MATFSESIASGIGLFDRHLEALRQGLGRIDFDAAYYAAHRQRFVHTLELIPVAAGTRRALEIGATAFLQVALHHVFGYDFVAGTEQSPDIAHKLYHKSIRVAELEVQNLTMSVDVENDILPFADSSLDLVLCCEVIEHLDIDPMFALAEINRVLGPDGKLLLTTPNACSSRCVWKVLQGYRPHFHVQYSRSRTPYRHNLEYDVHGLLALARAGGFAIEHLSTQDVFEPQEPAALALLEREGMPSAHRGDCIFLLLRKTGPVTDRWPDIIYVD
jgi:SAM-dependent methyltransferase